MNHLQDPIDAKVADYVRSRAKVVVPERLLGRAVERIQSSDVASSSWLARRAAFGAIAAALALAILVVVGLSIRPIDQTPSATARGVAGPHGSATPSNTATPVGGEFPTTIAGFRTISVAEAV